jgi:hypothetical protein
VTLTATVTCTGAATGPTGTVNFFDTTATPTFLGSGTLSGGPGTATTSIITSFTAPPSTHTVTAAYSGDLECEPSLGTTTVNATATTVAVAGTPNPATRLQPVAFTAVVTCTGDGDPTGSVTFTDTTTATVLGVDPTGTAGNGLTPGTHAIRAAFGGTANCAPSSGTLTVTVSTSQTISGNHFGTVTITAPTTMAPGTRVFGNVVISGSGSLAAEGVQIFGSLTASGGSGLRLCGSSVLGSTMISGMNGVIVIGDAGDDGSPACAGNALPGLVSLNGNTGLLEFSGNTAGGLVRVNNNATTITVPSENATATELEANRIIGVLSCTGNTPPPTNDGEPNTVIGTRTGQCRSL